MKSGFSALLVSACLLSACVGGIVGAGLFGVRDAWAQSGGSTLRTQRLEITDRAGNVRSVLSTNRSGQPFIGLLSEQKKLRLLIALNVDDGTPLIALNGSAGHDIIGVAVNANDTAALNFSDKANKVRGSLTIDDDGIFRIQQNDAQEKAGPHWP